jgi:hypothetical protein
MNLMKEAVVWWATAFANMVLPQPGGPYISTPLQQQIDVSNI